MGMEHLHPAFCRNFRYASRPRYWNLLENLFEQDAMSCQSNQVCCESKSMKKSVEKSSTEEGKPENQVVKTNEENKGLEPMTKAISKKFMSNVTCHENMEKVEIKIQLHGHKFKPENLDIQVLNGNTLVVKAKDDEEKFERKFKLSANTLVDKIESKFDVKEENIQTLLINIPKNITIVQVPIAMEE